MVESELTENLKLMHWLISYHSRSSTPLFMFGSYGSYLFRRIGTNYNSKHVDVLIAIPDNFLFIVLNE